MPGEKLFTSEGIAKQVVDCLMLQYRLGNTTPFVLLSSYREACLCRLKPGSLPAEDATKCIGDDKYQEIVANATELLEQRQDLNADLGEVDDAKQEQKPQNHSPTKTAFEHREDIPLPLVLREPRQKRARLHTRGTIELLSPEVVYSEPFDLKNMVHGVSLALVCGLVSLESASTKGTDESYWPKQGSCVDGLHPVVDRDNLQWAQVRKNMVIDYMSSPRTAIDDQGCQYILIQEIGRGNDGRVFLSIDCVGSASALKFYLTDDEAETSFTHTQRKKDRQTQLDANLKTAHEECARWQKLYRESMAHVGVSQLNEQAVLRMPVCSPVHPDDRESVLNLVKAELLRFFRAGYVYKEMRWQHVGCRRGATGALEVTLLDLGSLQCTQDNEGVDLHGVGIIDQQIDLLRRRIDTEPRGTAPIGVLPPVQSN